MISLTSTKCSFFFSSLAYTLTSDNRGKGQSTYWMHRSLFNDIYTFSFCRGNALRHGSAWRSSRATAALLLVSVSVFVVAVWLYVTSLDSEITETLVSQAEFVSPQPRVYTIQCSEDYNNYKRYPGEVFF